MSTWRHPRTQYRSDVILLSSTKQATAPGAANRPRKGAQAESNSAERSPGRRATSRARKWATSRAKGRRGIASNDRRAHRQTMSPRNAHDIHRLRQCMKPASRPARRTRLHFRHGAGGHTDPRFSTPGASKAYPPVRGLATKTARLALRRQERDDAAHQRAGDIQTGKKARPGRAARDRASGRR